MTALRLAHLLLLAALAIAVTGPHRAGADVVKVATSGGSSPDWDNRTYEPADLWAFHPIQRHAVPEDPGSPAGARNPVDAFIRHALKQKAVAAAGRADKLTLIRR